MMYSVIKNCGVRLDLNSKSVTLLAIAQQGQTQLVIYYVHNGYKHEFCKLKRLLLLLPNHSIFH